jgi:hypothetical protein
MSSGDSDGDVSPARTEADYKRLYDYGRARRQLPLELLLKMYRAGAIAGPGPNGGDDPKKGFLWKDAPQSNADTTRQHRKLLVELGFIHIPHWTPVSEEAKKRIGRKDDTAGPGYITTKGEDVCKYIEMRDREKYLTPKSRVTKSGE